ncbi:MAG: DUF2975 domain-containing protein [Lachnospiraceae bacterium]|jgi:hypothetical protein|nr:DUF2975 domain-containing protein [Lachnospiraceae bacterium]
MSAKSLGKWVHLAVISMFVCGFVVFVGVLAYLGINIDYQGGKLDWTWKLDWVYLVWLIFLWITALPCVWVLVLGWKVAGAISRDEAFTMKVAGWIKTAAMLIFTSVGIFFAGNCLFAILNMHHLGVLLLSFLIEIAGIAVAIVAATLSRYVTKAALLHEEVEGTI